MGSVDDGSRITIARVAARAGVSVGTVSNYINRPEIVAEPTRARIAQAIEDLGWVPNIAVRTIRRGRSALIGLVLSDISNPFFTDVARGVEQAASERGFTVILCNSDDSLTREDACLRTLSEYRAAGMLITPVSAADDERYLEMLRHQDSKFALLARPGPRPDPAIPWIGVDDVHGGRLVGDHLLDAGHVCICFVHGSEESHHVAQERFQGLVSAIEDHGLDPTETVREIQTDGLRFSDGIEAAVRFDRLDPRPTAIFAANDLLAVGLLRGLHDRGLRVPTDVAVVGYDDLDIAHVVTPTLTSVRQPRFELGKAAVRLLEAEISGATDSHAELIFTPELVVRESSATRM